MKKLFIILAVLALAPITVNATTIATSFDDSTCELHVTGTMTGAHQAQVVYYINNQFEGEGNNTVLNDNYEVVLRLAYDDDTTIKIRVADENGSNEEVKDNIVIPACTPPATTKTTELFSEEGHSISINDTERGFEEGDHFEVEINSKEDLDELLSSLQNDENYDTYKEIFDKMNTIVGEGNDLIFHIEPKVLDEFNVRIDYNDYNDGFVLNLLFPKEEYKKLNGLRLMSVDPATYDKLNDLDYTYDEENEVFIIPIDRPGVILAYIDSTIANQTSNPNTSDNINKYIIMFIISTLGLIGLGIYSKKKIFN